MRLRLRRRPSAAVMLAAPAAWAAGPTFSKDVAPILYKSCVECHRAGAMAPMSLMTYEDARPWARAIKTKVVKREMPPWGADPGDRQVRQRRQPEAVGDRHDRRVGRRRRAGRQPRRAAEGAAVHRGLVDRQARPGLQDDRAVHRSGRRHRAVPLRHGPDEPEGRHLGPRHRAEADRPPRRPPHHQRPRRGRRQGRTIRSRSWRAIRAARTSAASAASCRAVCIR